MFRISNLFLFFLVVFLAVSSCSKVQYRRTLNYWTKKDNIYSYNTLAAKVLWHATYLSSEYRATARARVNEWKKLEPGEMSSYASYLADNTPGTFLVSIYTPRFYPRLTTEADNFWEFTLNLPSGEAFLPASIESIKLTPRETRLFPYVNRWSQFYWVKFPVYDLNPPFALVIRSAGVTSMLEWN